MQPATGAAWGPGRWLEGTLGAHHAPLGISVSLPGSQHTEFSKNFSTRAHSWSWNTRVGARALRHNRPPLAGEPQAPKATEPAHKVPVGFRQPGGNSPHPVVPPDNYLPPPAGGPPARRRAWLSRLSHAGPRKTQRIRDCPLRSLCRCSHGTACSRRPRAPRAGMPLFCPQPLSPLLSAALVPGRQGSTSAPAALLREGWLVTVRHWQDTAASCTLQ